MQFLFLLLAVLWSVAVAGAAEPHPSLPPPVIPECLGVNIHFTDPKPGELEMLSAAGFKWVRMDLGWGGTERKKGEYDFSAYDRLVAALDQHKLRAIFILDYGNPLYAEPGDKHPFTSRASTEDFRAAYARWASAAVTHFQKRGYLWELWNEPNHKGFWKPQPDPAQYAALALAGAKAIRAAAPGEAIIGPATSTIDLAFLETCFQAGLLEYLDAVSVHPYRQQAPETATAEYRSLRLLIRKYAPKDKTIPVISGEWGYSTAYPAFAGKNDPEREDMQAQYVVRQFLTNIANDVALSIWYDWRDDGDDLKEAEHRFGIVRRPYRENVQPVFEPKPAYRAVKTLSEQFGGFRFNKELASDLEQHPLLFTKGDEVRVAFWGRSRDPDADWLPASPGKFSVTDYLGQALPALQADKGAMPRVKLRVEKEFPVYLRPEEPNDLLRLAAAWQRLPLEVVVDPDGTKIMVHSFRNPLDHNVVVFQDREQSIQPGEEWVMKDSIVGSRAESFLRSSRLVFPQQGEFGQVVHFISLAPLRMMPLPIFDRRLHVRLENPAGASIDGRLRIEPLEARELKDLDPVEPASEGVRVEFAVGEREKVVALPLKRVPRDFYRMHLVFEEFGRTTALATAVHRRVTLDTGDSAHAITYAAAPEGDPKVPSQQSVEVDSPVDLPAPAVGAASPFTFKYGFAAGWKFLRMTRSEIPWPSIAGSPREFGMWLYGDAKGCQARLRFTDSTGQSFQSDGPKIDWKGWRFITFPMQSTDGKRLSYWGGAKDGVIHNPIKWDTIFLLDNVSRQPIEGEIYLSGATLIY